MGFFSKFKKKKRAGSSEAPTNESGAPVTAAAANVPPPVPVLSTTAVDETDIPPPPPPLDDDDVAPPLPVRDDNPPPPVPQKQPSLRQSKQDMPSDDIIRQKLTEFYTLYEPSKLDTMNVILEYVHKNGVEKLDKGLLKKYGCCTGLGNIPHVNTVDSVKNSGESKQDDDEVVEEREDPEIDPSLIGNIQLPSKPTPQYMDAPPARQAVIYKSLESALKARRLEFVHADLLSMGIEDFTDLAKLDTTSFKDPVWSNPQLNYMNKKKLKNLVLEAKECAPTDTTWWKEQENLEKQQGEVRQQDINPPPSPNASVQLGATALAIAAVAKLKHKNTANNGQVNEATQPPPPPIPSREQNEEATQPPAIPSREPESPKAEEGEGEEEEDEDEDEDENDDSGSYEEASTEGENGEGEESAQSESEGEEIQQTLQQEVEQETVEATPSTPPPSPPPSPPPPPIPSREAEQARPPPLPQKSPTVGKTEPRKPPPLPSTGRPKSFRVSDLKPGEDDPRAAFARKTQSMRTPIGEFSTKPVVPLSSQEEEAAEKETGEEEEEAAEEEMSESAKRAMEKLSRQEANARAEREALAAAAQGKKQPAESNTEVEEGEEETTEQRPVDVKKFIGAAMVPGATNEMRAILEARKSQKPEVVENSAVVTQEDGQPCSQFRLDLAATAFNTCVCGFPKTKHGETATTAGPVKKAGNRWLELRNKTVPPPVPKQPIVPPPVPPPKDQPVEATPPPPPVPVKEVEEAQETQEEEVVVQETRDGEAEAEEAVTQQEEAETQEEEAVAQEEEAVAQEEEAVAQKEEVAQESPAPPPLPSRNEPEHVEQAAPPLPSRDHGETASEAAEEVGTAAEMEVIDYRGKVEAFYRKYNPEKLDTIDKIMQRFAGRETVLLEKLVKKYGAQENL